MKTGMNLQDMFNEVLRQSKAKRDMIISTDVGVRMVDIHEGPADLGSIIDAEHVKGRKRLLIETLPLGAQHLERFQINDTAHRQIGDWLGIPWKYYDRLCSDHPDLVVTQVNALFKREPGRRMFRTIDGKVRAFLSDRYRRIDNDKILTGTLPAILQQEGGMPSNEVIRSWVDDDSMRVTVVFTGPELEQVIGKTKDGQDDIVKPGFEITNSETGKGRFSVRGFFYRNYCRNGCVFTFRDFSIELTRNHIGGKLSTNMLGDILSDEAKIADDKALMLAARDVIKVMGTQEMAQRLGDALRAAKGSEPMQHVVEATEVLSNELGLLENESTAFLRNLIADRDFSRYGALNAVTAIANADETTQERAFELEELGSKILQMTNDSWLKVANAGEKDKVRVAA